MLVLQITNNNPSTEEAIELTKFSDCQQGHNVTPAQDTMLKGHPID
jgi:hypothetical protein